MGNGDFYEKPQIGDKCFVDNGDKKESNLYELLDTSPLGLNYGTVINIYKGYKNDMDEYVDVLIENGKNKGKIIQAAQYNTLKCFPFYLYVKFAGRVLDNLVNNLAVLDGMTKEMSKEKPKSKNNSNNVISIDFKNKCKGDKG